MLLKLIVLDVDGVLSRGEAQLFDPNLLARLANLNRRARQGEAVPTVTLNTGRPSPYVEAVMQTIEGWQPALYESGAGLYLPQTYQFMASPSLTSEHLARLRQIVERVDRAVVQPGKSVCYFLFAYPLLTLADFSDEVKAIVAEISGKEFVVTPTTLALNIHPARSYGRCRSPRSDPNHRQTGASGSRRSAPLHY